MLSDINPITLAIQSFNFKLEWVKGETNILADKLSRTKTNAEPYWADGNRSNGIARLCAMSVKNTSNRHKYFVGEADVGNDKEFISAYTLIGRFHNSHVGHMGVEKTKKRIRDAGYSWPNQNNDIQAFIKLCPCCQKMRMLTTPIVTNPYTVASYHPMDRLYVDTMGPFPEDKDGNQYIIVVIDGFTRFIELYKSKDTKGISAAEALLTHAGRYGTPDVIMTDNGTQFKNELVSHLQNLLGIQHNFTTPYSHEENAIVERANKEVNRHLRAIIFHKKIVEDWTLCLPLVQRIMNSQVHSATQVSPAQMLFGNAVQLERRMFLDSKMPAGQEPNSVPVSEYMDKLLSLQETIMNIAMANQVKLDNYHIKQRAVNSPSEFPINSYVLYADPSGLKTSGNTRLNTPLRGPFRVVNRRLASHQEEISVEGAGDVYVIENLVSHEMHNVHVKHLKPFEFNAEHVDPTEVAMTDNEEFLIEAIVGHGPPVDPVKFMKLKKSEMIFSVKYVGYPDPEPGYWENLRKTEQLHKYLSENGMKRLIPPAYRLNALMLMKSSQHQ